AATTTPPVPTTTTTKATTTTTKATTTTTKAPECPQAAGYGDWGPWVCISPGNGVDCRRIINLPGYPKDLKKRGDPLVCKSIEDEVCTRVKTCVPCAEPGPQTCLQPVPRETKIFKCCGKTFSMLSYGVLCAHY
ncbi:unnamed protein product, partial [Owenia fusiformis]